MANRESRASVFPDLTRSPIRNCHFQNPFRPGQRIFYAFVIYGNLPHSSAVTGAEPQSSIFHLLAKYICPRDGTAEILAL